MDEEFCTSKTIKALEKLISTQNSNVETVDDIQRKESSKSDSEEIKQFNHIKFNESTKKNKYNIWELSEVSILQNSQMIDPRKIPEYKMNFKQTVTAEDVFLGIGLNPLAPTSCQWLSIYVYLPGEAREDIKLDIKSETVDIRSPKFRLHLPTCHIIDPQKSSAKWHSDESTLELTLKIIHELDRLNF
ncbi:protein PIH1D3 [Chelonus insularis]|uniref:protein PIH1D3 n=1 Tax=Chelonus insularis TaxID=460826 RepID=UPI00158DE3A2|nr:protein PIH1D3 [Chelonus insularis]